MKAPIEAIFNLVGYSDNRRFITTILNEMEIEDSSNVTEVDKELAKAILDNLFSKKSNAKKIRPTEEEFNKLFEIEETLPVWVNETIDSIPTQEPKKQNTDDFIKRGKTSFKARNGYVLVLDTETTTTQKSMEDIDKQMENIGADIDTIKKVKEDIKKKSLAFPIIYDIAWAIYDIDGNKVLSRAFLTKEIFLNTKLMDSAYYKIKIPLYHARKVNRDYENFNNILELLRTDMDVYGIEEIMAYNCAFDKRAIKSTRMYIMQQMTNFATAQKMKTKYNDEFKVLDIWSLALATIGATNDYREFCRMNNLVTDSKKFFSSNAENMYLFTKQSLLGIWSESHTAMEDVAVESDIYFHILDNFNLGKKKMKELMQTSPMSLLKNVKI